MPASLADEGDDLERESWPDLKMYFPGYEVFWRLHVHPLRSSGSVFLREGLDEDLERMAIFHFSTYVSLARGFSKIKNRSEDFKYFEEIYANLFRASELAGETIHQFCLVYRQCLKNEIAIHTEKLVKVSAQLRVYRNLIHGNILATLRDSEGRRIIPKADRLDDYELWSRMRSSTQLSDFVDAEKQVWIDFRSLCSALQDSWKEMCGASDTLLKNADYVKRSRSGKNVQITVGGVPSASGDMWTSRFDPHK
jgi:hypothetical protein